MLNGTLLEDTMLHIRCNPELHNQSFFFEKTDFGIAACFAGRALLLSGHDPVWLQTGWMAERPDTGALVGVASEAQQLLRLDCRWAENLFSPLNTRQMLEYKVKDLLNGSPLRTYHELLSHGAK